MIMSWFSGSMQAKYLYFLQRSLVCTTRNDCAGRGTFVLCSCVSFVCSTMNSFTAILSVIIVNREEE